ncbi:MAG: phenylalanine--tRNA ligase subunit alpha [Planctomycetia bacterium]
MPDPSPVLDEIRRLGAEALAGVAAAGDAAALRALEAAALGPEAPLSRHLKAIPRLPAEQRGPVGREANEAKRAIQAAVTARLAQLEQAREAQLADVEWVDPTLPGAVRGGGRLHPVMQVCRELEDIFLGLGFDLLDGPWVEDDLHNFTALNIPADHPARDMQDTFWLQDGRLLRTHTSPVQVRALRAQPPPIRAVALGRIFRHEELDATHENTFHQVEGLLVDRDVSAAHLVWVLRTVLQELFGRDVETRLRPAYFPFVEPGFEMDMRFRGRWMEILGCGLVHPGVLRAGGLDPDTWSGLAFGMGVDRIAMLRHGIEDIRHLMAGDLRFLRQMARGTDA